MIKQCIAITGTTGFVGKNLLPYLGEQGLEIFSVVRDGSSGDQHTVSFNEFDAGYIDRKNIHTVIHMAGKAHDLKNTGDEADYFHVNTTLTKKIFDSFIQSSATLFVYISSVKAVADAPDAIVTEDLPAAPQTPYGRSKFESEKYLLSKPLSAGKRCVILRPCMIHGPDNKGNLNTLYKFVDMGIPYPLGAFENRRSFLGIDNFCYVMYAIIIHPLLETGIYNIADDEALSTNELIREIGKITGSRAWIFKWNRYFIKQVARLGDLFHLPFNSHNLAKLTENFVVSNTKLLQALDIKMPVSALEGIRKTIRSFVVHK